MNDITISPEIYDAIYAAIEQVFSETGRKPKYSEVMKNYKTSNSYIKIVLSDWVEKNSDALSAPRAVESAPMALSSETIAALSRSFLAELERARGEVERELDDERQSLYKIRDDALAEMSAQMEIADTHYQEALQMNAKNDSLAEKIEAISSQLTALQGQHEAALAKNSRLEGELARLQARYDETDAVLAKTKTALATAITEANSNAMRCDEWQQRGERLTDEINNQRNQIANRDKKIDSLSNELLEGRRQIAALEGNSESLSQQNSELEIRLQAANDEIKKISDAHSTLMGEYKFLKMKTDDIKNAVKTS